jgi:copper chaperone CopZ
MDGSGMRHIYGITGMHCAGCVKKVSDALRDVDGVIAAAVTLVPPEVRLETAGVVTQAQLEAALAPLGNYRLQALRGQSHGSDLMVTASPSLGDATPRESLYPLVLIVGYIALTVALVARVSGDASAHTLMSNFMAGFFLVFSFFKLLDLDGFADAYRSYDLIAQAVPAWGKAYPFVELALGAAYLLRVAPVATNLITLVLMAAGAAGVWKALANKQKLRCACLGTALNLPMTTVTLVEDIGMATMAAAMLLTMG